jgi:hypothetical protein
MHLYHLSWLHLKIITNLSENPIESDIIFIVSYRRCLWLVVFWWLYHLVQVVFLWMNIRRSGKCLSSVWDVLQAKWKLTQNCWCFIWSNSSHLMSHLKDNDHSFSAVSYVRLTEFLRCTVVLLWIKEISSPGCLLTCWSTKQLDTGSKLQFVFYCSLRWIQYSVCLNCQYLAIKFFWYGTY